MIISPENASKLTVNCSASSCVDSKIFCPLGINTECNVICNELDACKNTIIDGSNTGTITLTCNAEDYSCRDPIIRGTFANTINLNCNSVRCHDIQIYGENITTANINCYGNGVYGCELGDFYFNYAENIILNCVNRYACRTVKVYGTHSDSVTLIARGADYASNSVQIYGEYSNNYTVYCYGYKPLDGSLIHRPCWSNQYYLPEDLTKVNIYCYSSGCYTATLYTQSLVGYQDLSITTNFCGQCDGNTLALRGDNCISSFTLRCPAITSSSATFAGDDCGTFNPDRCNCDIMASNTVYMDDINDPNCIVDTIECDTFPDCVIDCVNNDCRDQIIDASSATTLNVYCNTTLCSNTNIYCPQGIGSECNVICNYEHACKDTVIHGTTTDSISLNCNGEDQACMDTVIRGTFANNITFNCNSIECYNVQIYGDNATSANINCYGNFNTTSINKFGCRLGDFYLNYADTININCVYEDGCSGTELYANYANSITFIARDGHDASTITIYAENATDINIYCYGFKALDSSAEYKVCLGNVYYLPADLTKVNMYCYGVGCSTATLYTPSLTGFADLSITTNLCGQCSGDSLVKKGDACIGQFALKCPAITTNTAYFYGDDCGTFSPDRCNCSSMANNTILLYTDNVLDESCPVQKIECNSNTDCDLNCTNGGCQETYIDLSVSNVNVTVNCSDDCSRSILFCPDNVECQIMCQGPSSCDELTIYGGTNTDLVIHCSDASNPSCNEATIYANNVNSLNMICNGGCNRMTLYALYAKSLEMYCESCSSTDVYANYSDTISIYCMNKRGCSSNTFSFTNATSVYMYNFGDQALYRGDIYTQSVQESFNLICKGNSTYKEEYPEYITSNPRINEIACYEPTIYTPIDMSKFGLDCYSFGCQDLTLFNTVSDFSEWKNLTFNFCADCIDLYECMSKDEWLLQCPEGRIGFRGTQCRNVLSSDSDLTICGCNNLIQNAIVKDEVINEAECVNHGMPDNIDEEIAKRFEKGSNSTGKPNTGNVVLWIIMMIAFALYMGYSMIKSSIDNANKKKQALTLQKNDPKTLKDIEVFESLIKVKKSEVYDEGHDTTRDRQYKCAKCGTKLDQSKKTEFYYAKTDEGPVHFRKECYEDQKNLYRYLFPEKFDKTDVTDMGWMGKHKTRNETFCGTFTCQIESGSGCIGVESILKYIIIFAGLILTFLNLNVVLTKYRRTRAFIPNENQMCCGFVRGYNSIGLTPTLTDIKYDTPMECNIEAMSQVGMNRVFDGSNICVVGNTICDRFNKPMTTTITQCVGLMGGNDIGDVCRLSAMYESMFTYFSSLLISTMAVVVGMGISGIVKCVGIFGKKWRKKLKMVFGFIVIFVCCYVCQMIPGCNYCSKKAVDKYQKNPESNSKWIERAFYVISLIIWIIAIYDTSLTDETFQSGFQPLTPTLYTECASNDNCDNNILDGCRDLNIIIDMTILVDDLRGINNTGKICSYIGLSFTILGLILTAFEMIGEKNHKKIEKKKKEANKDKMEDNQSELELQIKNNTQNEGNNQETNN